MAGPQLDRRAPAEPPGVAGHHRAHGLHPGGDHLADVWHAPVVAAHLGAAYALDPVIQALRSIPLLGLLPLFIVWFGIGEMPKDLIVLLGALFPMYINTFAGIRSVDPKLGELGQVLGLSRWELIRHIVLPGALPSALTGVRLSVIGSLLALVVVVGEQINANAGLGFMITTAQEFLQNNIIMVCLIVYAILGLTADWGVRVVERRALAWRRDFVR
jgi:sulfonate transport system permease protein